MNNKLKVVIICVVFVSLGILGYSMLEEKKDIPNKNVSSENITMQSVSKIGDSSIPKDVESGQKDGQISSKDVVESKSDDSNISGNSYVPDSVNSHTIVTNRSG